MTAAEYDVVPDFERDLSYARSIKTLHSVVRLSVGNAAIVEIKRLRQQVEELKALVQTQRDEW